MITARELMTADATCVRASDTVLDAARAMAENNIRRVPVLDGDDIVGIIAQADVARALPDRPVGDLLKAISTD